jgi:hypothetical protein
LQAKQNKRKKFPPDLQVINSPHRIMKLAEECDLKFRQRAHPTANTLMCTKTADQVKKRAASPFARILTPMGRGI